MHPEALTSDTKKLWPQLRQFPDFVLGGGTALALHIGHRISVDFDLFSEREIEPGLLPRAEGVFKGVAVKVILNTPGQLTLQVDGTNLTFLTYRFPPIDNPIEYEGVRLFTISDIAAAKAYALGRRATLKDYVDLYFIIAEGHCPLTAITAAAQKKYGDLFDPRLFFEQLVYLEDVAEEKIQFVKPPVDKAAIQTFFEKEISNVPILE